MLANGGHFTYCLRPPGIPRCPRRRDNILSTLVISHELESALQEQCVSLHPDHPLQTVAFRSDV